MKLFFPFFVPTQTIQDEWLEKKQIHLDVKRLDLLDSHIQGNKWFKLKYHIARAQVLGKRTILTFGGAYSNHLYATATVAQQLGFQAIMIVRGEETLPLNPVLQYIKNAGCQIVYWDRATYRNFREAERPLGFLRKDFPNTDFYCIPEGGADGWGVKGCADILQKTDQYDYVLCACGTGTMLAGLCAKPIENTQFLGFSALKNGSFLEEEVEKLIEKYYLIERTPPKPFQKNFQICTTYDFGGYAKKTAELENFINFFYQKTQIPLEPIYTGKLFFGAWDLIKKDFFPKKSRLLLIHSGGLRPMYTP